MSIKDHVLVLYVEDEETDAILMRLAFQRRGSQDSLKIVRDGEAAIQYLARGLPPHPTETLPDLVLLDINLPKSDGFDVLQWIRSIPELASLPVVMFSSSDHPHDIERASALGATDYVQKMDIRRLDSLVADLRKYLNRQSQASGPAGPPEEIRIHTPRDTA